MEDSKTSITDQFQVYLKDPCADNSLSIANSDVLVDQLYYVSDPAHPVQATVSQTVSISTCPLTVVLEYWDETARIWRDHSDLTSTAGQEEYSLVAYTASFVQNFQAVNTGYFEIYTTDANDEYDGPTTAHTEI